jgi:hypothetical protein
MKVYPPSHLTPEESIERQKAEKETTLEIISDETIKEYIHNYFKHYRNTLEQFFSTLAPYLAFYAEYPYETLILRMGINGFIIGHKPSPKASIQVMQISDFDPPLPSFNLFDIIDRWQTPFNSFDFSVRQYNAGEAELDGIRRALADALNCLWITVETTIFSKLSVELIQAEGVEAEAEKETEDLAPFDFIGKVLVPEPAGYRRYEQWGFQFKTQRENRVSAKELRELEVCLEEQKEIDTICLITSGDLTSIGKHITVTNPKIRVWDRSILNRLVNIHLHVLEKYFPAYAVAIKSLSEKFSGESSDIPLGQGYRKYFADKLAACPAGRKHFAVYEETGTELWQHLFQGKLGEPRTQRGTSDRVQRRDVVFRNLRSSPFFQRIFHKFDSDLIVVDFKNYKNPLSSSVIEEVEQYANKAVGRLIVVVSRKGTTKAAEKAQHRLLRDKDTLILSISDQHMLEMISRKERGESPEDVLEDLLDELLVRY